MVRARAVDPPLRLRASFLLLGLALVGCPKPQPTPRPPPAVAGNLQDAVRKHLGWGDVRSVSVADRALWWGLGPKAKPFSAQWGERVVWARYHPADADPSDRQAWAASERRVLLLSTRRQRAFDITPLPAGKLPEADPNRLGPNPTAERQQLHLVAKWLEAELKRRKAEPPVALVQSSGGNGAALFVFEHLADGADEPTRFRLVLHPNRKTGWTAAGPGTTPSASKPMGAARSRAAGSPES